MNLPVIATGAGGVQHVVADGRTGLLVPPRDSGALAERIVDLLDDPLRARAIGQAAHDYVVAEFPVDRMVEQTREHVPRGAWRRAGCRRLRRILAAAAAGSGCIPRFMHEPGLSAFGPAFTPGDPHGVGTSAEPTFTRCLAAGRLKPGFREVP